MRFTQGYWVIRQDYVMSYATQTVRVIKNDKELHIISACRPIRHRGDILDGGSLDIVFTAPRKGEIEEVNISRAACAEALSLDESDIGFDAHRPIVANAGVPFLFVPLADLTALARARPRGVEAMLVTPSPWQYYSGMLPGWMAGHYREDDCRIDLRPLAAAAGARGRLRR